MLRRPLTAAIVGLLLAATAVAVGARSTAPATEPLPRAAKVLVVGMPHTGIRDLDAGDTPVLDGLVRRGAVAALAARGARLRGTTAEGYATLGAGARVRVRDRTEAEEAFETHELVGGEPAGVLLTRRSGIVPKGGIVVPGGPALVRDNRPLHLPSDPGALGKAMRAAGLTTAVVDNSDSPDLPVGTPHRIARPAALAVMDRTDFSVDTGEVRRRSLLRLDAQAPGGARFDAAAMRRAVREALSSADVVTIDAGDLERAYVAAAQGLAATVDTQRRLALRRTDRLLGELMADLPPRTLVMVVGPTPVGSGGRLAPLVLVGPGIPVGRAWSDSTKRSGVVPITDLAPTILKTLGAKVPKGMVGRTLRVEPRDPRLDSLQRLDRETAAQQALYRPFVLSIVLLAALAFGGAVALLARPPGPGWLRAVVRAGLLAIAAMPAAAFVVRLIPGGWRQDATTSAALLALAVVVLAAAAWRIGRGRALPAVGVLAGVTVALIAGDLVIGSRLHVSNVLGYAMDSGGRSYGLPNTTFAALGAAAIVLAAAVATLAKDRAAVLPWIAVGFGLLVVIVGAPGLGDDVGGILTLVPVLGLTWLGLAGRRWDVRTVGLVALAAIGVLLLAGFVDLLRPPASRTHLGRFLSDLGDDGPSLLWDTASRKQSTNWRLLKSSPWSWLVPVVPAFAVWLLWWRGFSERLLPQGGALRAGAWGVVGLTVIGFLANDSGPIVLVLGMLMPGALLALLALEAPAPDPHPGAAARRRGRQYAVQRERGRGTAL